MSSSPAKKTRIAKKCAKIGCILPRAGYNGCMLTTLFFDIDNTLLDFSACSKDSMQRAFEDYGLHFADDMFDTFVAQNNMLWRRIELGELTKDGLFKIRWNIIFEKLGIAGVDGEEFEEDFHKYLNVSCVPVDGAKQTLKYLSGKYRLYAASNAPLGQQPRRMKLADLDKYMDGYFISEELGAPKPSKRFFDECFARLDGVTPAQVMMIGDSKSADIDGARQYGMATCWFNFLKTKDADVRADIVIDDLRKLQDLL